MRGGPLPRQGIHMNDTPEEPACCSAAQLAKRWSVSRQQIYNLVAAKKLTCIYVGTLMRFRPQDIAAIENPPSIPATKVPPSPVSAGNCMFGSGMEFHHAAFLAGLRARETDSRAQSINLAARLAAQQSKQRRNARNESK